MKKKIFAFILSFAMLMNMTYPISSVSVIAGDLDCQHHMEHTADCGYVESVEGHACIHVCESDCYKKILDCPHEAGQHDAICGYIEATTEIQGSPCIHGHTQECYIVEIICTHQHDGTCGYVEGVENSCTHSCDNICQTAVKECVHTQHDASCGYVEAVEGRTCNFICSECSIDIVDTETMPEESEIQETTEEIIAKETTEEESVVKETPEEETVAKETTEEETVVKETPEEETVAKETTEEETVAEETTGEETVAEETTEEETVAEETTEEKTVAEETTEEETVAAETIEEETVAEETTEDEIATEETTEGETVAETTEEETETSEVMSFYEQLMMAETLQEIVDLINEDVDSARALTAEEIDALEIYVNFLNETSPDQEAYENVMLSVETLRIELKNEDEVVVTTYELDANYNVYFDLYYGDVTITSTTYSGWIYDGTGQPTYKSGTHLPNNKYYIFQSKGEALTGIPQYARLKGGAWGDFITNNTDVLNVIAEWDKEAAAVGREATKSSPKKNNYTKEDIYVQQHHRIILNGNGEGTTFNVTIDNVWSGFQNDDCKDAEGILYDRDNVDTKFGISHRVSGGLSFIPGSSTAKAYIYLKGDNRFGNIHYNVNAGAGGSTDNTKIDQRTEQFFFYNGEPAGNPSGTMTVANLNGDNGYNHFDAVIGGSNASNYVPGLVFEGGDIFAGATEIDNCTAIGGGGCGFGGVTIRGGRITAVTATNGTAIGGGIGDGSNGGAANVLISGGEVYAYNFGIAIHGTRETNATTEIGKEVISVVMPAVAIGSGSSRRNYTVPAEIEITAGKVYAQSTGGTAIGGGSSNNYNAAQATIKISGGNITAKSIAGEVRTIYEYDAGGPATYVNSSSNNVSRNDSMRQTVSASTSIGGGTAGVPFEYNNKNPYDKIKDQQNGGNCILTITGGTIYTGSIGGGGANELPNPTSGKEFADRYTNVAKGSIGSAQVTITGGTIQGQVIMAKGAAMDCFFNMSGGTIDNITKTDAFVFLKENGGAVYVENGNATMSGGRIQNTNAVKGGVFYVSGGNVTLSGTSWIQNSKATNGGVAYVMGGSVTMKDGTVTNCSADDTGGGFYIAGGSMSMSGGIIQNCMANCGAAGYVANGNFTMRSGIMQNNGTLERTEYGGAVYVKGGNLTIGIENCTQDVPVLEHTSPGFHPLVQNNKAKFGGGLAVSGEVIKDEQGNEVIVGGKLILYCCRIADNSSDNAGTGMNIYVDNGDFVQYLNGASIGKENGEDVDHGVVMVGGNMQIIGEAGQVIKINYHSNYGMDLTWTPEAPEDYWLNLPYCPKNWSDDQASKDLVFVGWGDHLGGSEAHSVRDVHDYYPIGYPIRIKDMKNKDGEVHLYAIWAPIENKIEYAYSLDAARISDRKFEGTIIHTDSNNEIFGGQSMPTTYQFTSATQQIDVPTPSKDGYTFVKWMMYASSEKISNWNADAYKVDENGNAIMEDGEPVLDDKPTKLSVLYDESSMTDHYAWRGYVQQNFGDIVLVAVFTENHSDIKYEIVGPENCGTLTVKEELNILTVTGNVYGTTATVNPGYKIIGWYTDAACTSAVPTEWLVNTGTAYINQSEIKPKKDAAALWANPTVYYVKFDYAVADLIISIDDYDAEYSYVFTITGTPDDGIEFEPLQIVLYGEQDSLVVKSLPVGQYTVTMEKKWAWRFTEEAQDVKIDGQTKHEVPFTNLSTDNNYWLDGSNGAANIFEKQADGSYLVKKAGKETDK